jgi:hypothetical protein
MRVTLQFFYFDIKNNLNSLFKSIFCRAIIHWSMYLKYFKYKKYKVEKLKIFNLCVKIFNTQKLK